MKSNAKQMLIYTNRFINCRKQPHLKVTKVTNSYITMAKRAAGFVIFRRLQDEIEFLLLKASYGNFHWSAPKGHVDPGEDDYTTAVRETREEAGYTEEDLNIYKDNPITLNYEVKGKPKVVIYWLAELNDPSKEPTLSEEHTELKWLTKEAAKEIVGYKDNQEMIDKFYEVISTLCIKK